MPAILRSMDPSRKRRIRLVVALTVAVAARRRARLHELLRLERGQEPQPAAGQRRRRSLLPAHRQGRPGLSPRGRRRAVLPRARPQRHRVGARPLHRPGARSVPRRARGHRRRAQAGRRLRRREGLARDEVPVEVQGRHEQPDVLTLGRACLILGRADRPLRHRRLALRGAHRAARVGRLRAPRRLRARRRR